MSSSSKANWAAFLIFVYILGGFLTNSYVRLVRLEHWYSEASFRAHADFQMGMATLLWPAYWFACLCDWIVEHLRIIWL